VRFAWGGGVWCPGGEPGRCERRGGYVGLGVGRARLQYGQRVVSVEVVGRPWKRGARRLAGAGWRTVRGDRHCCM
jgi:hypothetical protein